jgi:hypothetical protein
MLLQQRGIIMQQAGSQQAASQQTKSQPATSPGQAQPSRKRPAIVAGLGAAVIASAVTLVIMMSGSSAPVTVADGASTTAVKECQMTQRKFYVATQTGSGVVRLREGNYLSAPITLSAQPQAVVFPLPRPDVTPVDEVITIEGNSSNVIITSDFNPKPRIFDVAGVTAFPVTWVPVKKC